MVRTSRDCQSFTRHLLKAAIIQALWSTLEIQTQAQLISGSLAVPLGLGLGVGAPPFTCTALAGSHSRQSVAPEGGPYPFRDSKAIRSNCRELGTIPKQAKV